MSALNSKSEAENIFWLKGSPKKDFYLCIEINAKKSEEQKSRSPLNISLVVDRSGSMEGDKLKYVKKAVEFVIDNVQSTDYLSVVQYDDRIETIIPSQLVENKHSLKQTISSITSRGMTNLSGGMFQGYQEVKNTQKQGYVNRVLLLSDGLANEGITDEEKLNQIAQKKFREEGIGLSTFGVGADFNEHLMTNLSEYGGGNYYFIELPDRIPEIFAKELQGLISVVAQNTNVKITLPEGYFTFEKSYGYLASTPQANTIEVKLNDVFSEEKKVVLIKLKVLKEIDREVQIKTEISHEDVLHTLSRITEETLLKIQPTIEDSLFNQNISQNVLKETVNYVANELFEKAMLQADNRDFDAVRATLKQAKDYLEQYFQLAAPSKETKAIYDKICKYEANIENLKNMQGEEQRIYQKASRIDSYMMRKKRFFEEDENNE